MTKCKQYLDEQCVGDNNATVSTDFGFVCRDCWDWIHSPAW